MAFARAANYFKRKAFEELHLPHPELLTSKEKRRLKHYFYGTTYLSIIFCTLRGHIRTQKEKHKFTNLAALAYFFDDLVDTYRDQDDSGVLWKNNPEEYGKTADDRGLALHFLGNIYKELPHENLAEFKTYMHRVFNVETAGRQQREDALPLEELAKITAEKGGNSVLLFRRVLANPLSDEEKNALFQFGYLIQLCDDIFDLWFDIQDGITTLPMTLLAENKTEELMKVFENQVLATKKAFFQTPYPKSQIRTSLATIHYIVTVTRVCLRHYQKVQQEMGHLPFNDRSLMVVDMEKWHNRLRSAWYLISKS